MRLSTITNTAYVITVLLSMIGAITMLLASAALETEREAVARRHVFDAATSELDIDIFHLSDKAREYVITGNEEYLEDYHAAMSVLAATEARLRNIQGLGATEYELATLEDAIRAGGSSLRDHTQADGTLGYFQHSFAVYDREGQACRTPGCKGTVARLVQSNRSTFHCPACQS